MTIKTVPYDTGKMNQEMGEKVEKSKSGLRRIVLIHDLIKNNTYPNTKLLSEKFEVSKRTIEHDIQYMKDQLASPMTQLQKNY